MRGAPLDGAKRALVDLVRRLEPTDDFGLVGESGGTLLMVSDGHVNTGLREPDEFASLAAKAYADRLVTSTLGYGDGYDETLLSALARAGAGNHVFAADPDAAGAAIAEEVDGLLYKVVQGLALTVSMASEVAFVRLYNDLLAVTIADGAVLIDLGDLYGQERRKLLLEFAVPGDAAAGRVPGPASPPNCSFSRRRSANGRRSSGGAPEASRADIEAEIAPGGCDEPALEDPRAERCRTNVEDQPGGITGPTASAVAVPTP